MFILSSDLHKRLKSPIAHSCKCTSIQLCHLGQTCCGIVLMDAAMHFLYIVYIPFLSIYGIFILKIVSKYLPVG